MTHTNINEYSFEWYYFDVHTDSGLDIVFTVHTKPFNTVFDVQIWDLFIYQQNKLPVHHFFSVPKGDCSLELNPLKIQKDDKNYVLKKADKIYISVCNNNIELNLTFVPDRRYINKPMEFDLFPHENINPELKFKFQWILYYPFSDVSGELYFEGKKNTIRGRGYHDFNAGNFRLNRYLEKWNWVKYYFENKLLIYGEIRGRDNSLNRILVDYSEGMPQVYDKITKSIEENRVKFEYNGNEMELVINNKIEIDRIKFYMPRGYNSPVVFTKMREAAAYLSSKAPLIKPFRNILCNVIYSRSRSEGEIDSIPFWSFQEEIHF